MLYLVTRFHEMVRTWAGIALKSASPVRTVLVPAERITQAFRREIAANPDWRNLLIGTRFVCPVGLAADMLLLAGNPARPGAEDVEPVMLEELFDGSTLEGKLKYFDIEQLRTGAGFADAFARTFDDLRSAGIDSSALRAAAKSAPDQISRGRFLDLATVLDALKHPYADRHKILRKAGKVAASSAGSVFACLLREPEESELEFLSSLPNINAAFLTANPRYPEDEARIEQLARRLGGLPAGDLQKEDSKRDEISILKRYLFADPRELARSGRPVSRGSDGTVQTELHSGVAEEIEAAVDWVSDRIVAGVPLERIAIIVPESDPLAAMLHGRLALAVRDLDRDDLALEAAFLLRRHRLQVAVEREPVLLFTRHAGFLRRVFGVATHVAVAEAAPQAVADDAVHQILVAELHAAAQAEQVVRRARHALLAARHHDLVVAGLDGLGREHHRLETRAAHLVDRQRGNLTRQARMNGGLARRRLPRAALHHVPHDHFVDVFRVHARALDRFADGDCAESGRRERRERAEELADRRAGRGDDDGGARCVHALSPRAPKPDWRSALSAATQTRPEA